MRLIGRLARTANTARLAVYLIALWKLSRHPQAPRGAKLLAMAIVAYAVSPIDLVPDFIPVLGQLDDLLLIPIGVALVVRLTPKPLWESLLREAEATRESLPRWWWGAAVIVLVWAVLLALFAWWLVRLATSAA
jgi:uncharacterized membrane protein YkvA (DUF1232 family)